MTWEPGSTYVFSRYAPQAVLSSAVNSGVGWPVSRGVEEKLWKRRLADYRAPLGLISVSNVLNRKSNGV